MGEIGNILPPKKIVLCVSSWHISSHEIIVSMRFDSLQIHMWYEISPSQVFSFKRIKVINPHLHSLV